MRRCIWKENYPLFKQICDDSKNDCRIISEFKDHDGDDLYQVETTNRFTRLQDEYYQKNRMRIR
jgi:uncharacterized protein YktA (UPF0223 family)